MKGMKVLKKKPGQKMSLIHLHALHALHGLVNVYSSDECSARQHLSFAFALRVRSGLDPRCRE